MSFDHLPQSLTIAVLIAIGGGVLLLIVGLIPKTYARNFKILGLVFAAATIAYGLYIFFEGQGTYTSPLTPGVVCVAYAVWGVFNLVKSRKEPPTKTE